MMRTTLIRTIARASINALAYQGIRPSECFSQVHDTVLKNLGEEHAACFAEPVLDRHEGFIDWYVPFAGNVRPLNSLDEAERMRAYESFVVLAGEIRDYAEKLIAGGDPQRVTRGNLLLLSLNYPGEEDLYLVGGRPVVTCWGFGPGTTGAKGLNLCDLRFVTAPRPITPAVAAKVEPAVLPDEMPTRKASGFAFLPWLFPLLLLFLLLCLLFADFGGQKALSGRSLLSLPSFWEEKGPAKSELQLVSLEDELRLLEQKSVILIAQCPSSVPVAVQPKPPAVSETSEELVIPTDVQDTGFLKGRWLCATGLVNSKTHEPVKVEFVFDAKGQGYGNIYDATEICTGSARARMDEGALRIEHDALVCAQSGSSYSPNAITCTNVNGRTDCQGHNTSGDAWSAVFLKLKED